MPLAIQADWDLIKQLYVSGVPILDIERQTGVKQGTICGRASRARWKDIAIRAKEAMQPSRREGETLPAVSVGKHSARARAALADVIVRSAEKLAEQPIKTGRHALKVNQEAEAMVRNARTVFGWTEGQAQAPVRISIMGQTIVQTDRPAIDVTSPPAIE